MLKLMITLLVSLSLLTGGANIVQAAAPGDLLYPLDRALEEIRLRITTDPVKETFLQIQFAGERLAEAELKLGQNKLEHALTALIAYDEAVDTIEEQLENHDGQVRSAVRTMTQEELALQAGTLDRIRLSWPEDAQARHAYQNALQRSNMGLEQLLGPPESAPQGPYRQNVEGPVHSAPHGPNQEAPQGPSEEKPYGPAEGAPYGPSESGPHGTTKTPPKGSTKTNP